MPRHRAAAPLVPLLTLLLAGCGATPPTPPPSPTVHPTPTPQRPRFTQPVSQQSHHLLATLPLEAGGETFDGVRIVDDYLHVGHPVDDVLEALQRDRVDAVSVFRYGDHATIGAVTVQGVDNARLFETFVMTWHAPAVLERRQRLAAGTLAWELRARLGSLSVIYMRGNVVHVVETEDAALLEAILLDMTPAGLR